MNKFPNLPPSAAFCSHCSKKYPTTFTEPDPKLSVTCPSCYRVYFPFREEADELEPRDLSY
jgi:DNA-directed RNA polymerase subunit RPC12/RpoP